MSTTTAARTETLYMAMELSNSKWKLAFSQGQKIRQVSIRKGDRLALEQQLARAKEKLGLAPACPVRACYEAGRDGFWIDRLLKSLKIDNRVIDSASIQVDRRRRRAKTDRLDAEQLVRLLMRYVAGDTQACRVVRVPLPDQEDERRPSRELERLKKERTAHRARLKSLLALHGVAAPPGRRRRLEVGGLRDWQGQPLGAALQAEWQRERERLELLQQQIAALEKLQQQRLTAPKTAVEQVAAQLWQLRGIGPVAAWLLAGEFFAWRKFRNRRQVGALAGLCGTPYDSGQSAQEQGISKAGNKRVRWLAVELAWGWLQFQPQSELSQWFWKRFGHGSSRQRRVGIVALARKLLVALWKQLEFGELPAGALRKAH